jgi:prefoldin subunit 5
MTTAEKILSGFIVILLIICVVLGVQKSNLDIEIGAGEYAIIKMREAKIESYDNQIEGLTEKIVTLQIENDSLRNEKAKIRTVTIHEIDSIRFLPFDGKRVFWTAEVTRLDTVRTRYLSRD